MTALLLVSAAAFSAQGARDVAGHEQQKALLESLVKLPDSELAESKRDRFQQQLRNIELGQLMSPSRIQETQREVEDRLKPVPIQEGLLAPQLDQIEFDMYRPLTAQQRTQLLGAATSVARVETILPNGGSVPRGTAFVVGPDLVATNCHVWTSIAALGPSGQWQLRPGNRVHFADSPAHDLTREFEVLGIAGFSSVAGLDVAVLRVRQESIEGNMPLPAKLAIRASPLSPTWPTNAGLPIAVVGYPNITRSGETNYVELRARGQFAKIYSPGMVLQLATVQQVGLLLHIASTTDGSSGSPVFATDNFDVIGVHSCCTAAGTPPVTAFPCSQILQAPATRNIAIASATLASDQQLAPFFRSPRP
jgi:hypothetical protein